MFALPLELPLMGLPLCAPVFMGAARALMGLSVVALPLELPPLGLAFLGLSSLAHPLSKLGLLGQSSLCGVAVVWNCVTAVWCGCRVPMGL